MSQESSPASSQASANSSPSGSNLLGPIEPIHLKGSYPQSVDPTVGPLTPRGDDDLTPRTAAQGTQMLTPRSADAARKGAIDANQKLREKYGVSSNEAATWAVHIIETKTESDESTVLEVVFDWIGGTSTFGAMTGQGFLAILLMDEIIEQFENSGLNQYFSIKAIKYTATGIRITLDLAAGIGASEGKRLLLRSFNTSTFKAIAHAKYWRETYIDAKWEKRDVAFFTINTFHTLVASGVFAYITHIGCVKINQLLARYNNFLTDIAAEIVISTPSNIFFMGTSFISNLFGFPFINKGGVAVIGEGVNYLINDPSLKDYRRNVRTDIRNVQNHWRETYGKKDDAPKILDAFLHLLKNNINARRFLAGNEGAQGFVLADINRYYKQHSKVLAALLYSIPDDKKSSNLTDNDKADILKMITKYFEDEATFIMLKLYEGITPKSHAAFNDVDKTRMLVNIRHLSNIISTNKIKAKKAPFSLRTEEQWSLFLLKHSVASLATGSTITGLENFLDMSADAAAAFAKLLHFSASYITLPMQVMCYTAMIMLALGVYKVTMNLFESLIERNRPISFYSKLYEFTWLFLISILLLIGGFPNAAQSRLAGQVMAMTVLAIVASLFIEYSPFSDLIFESKIADECAKNPAKHLALLVDRQFDKLEEKVAATDANELNSLKAILPPRVFPLAVPVSSPVGPAAPSEHTPLLLDIRLPVDASSVQQNLNTAEEIKDFRAKCPTIAVGLSNLLFAPPDENKPKWKAQDVGTALSEEARHNSVDSPQGTAMVLN